MLGSEFWNNYGFSSSEGNRLYQFRVSFLKRKNINKFKRLPTGTPPKLSKLINCFDRKIDSVPIFDHSTKERYYKELAIQCEKLFSDKICMSRRQLFRQTNAQIYIDTKKVYRKKTNPNYLTFKEFLHSKYNKKYLRQNPFF